jgi:hypothetical protein
MKISKRICFGAACAVSVSFLAGQQRNEPADLPPSPLEAFAARSTAKLVLSKTIGSFVSQKSRATVAIVVVEDPTASPKLMRGLRIDLAHSEQTPQCDWRYSAWQIMCRRPDAAVYVEEARLEKVRSMLWRGVADLRPGEFISAYESNSPASGLIICGYDFPDRSASQLAELLTVALAELKSTAR